ncbi:hypothetical protein SDC9_118751 [bioreactor metagenome]|uniref:Uncharacterized protein n=1 Tax=bioreactor metagenome TaxID=1076179 RepID=A0A645C1Z1_9ZZZZ
MIFLAGYIAGAGRAAFADMIHQAGAFAPRNHARNILFALTNGVLFSHQRQTIPQEQAGEEGAEIFRAILFDAADDFQPWEILPKIDANIGEMFVILEENVVFRFEFLD